MNIAVVTDELSDDLETALELASDLGLTSVELRGVGGLRVPRIGAFWQRRTPELLQRFRMRVVAISPGIFKIPLPQPVPEGFQVLRWQDLEESTRERHEVERLLDHRTALLEESLALAKRLECPKVIIFGVVRSPGERAMPPLVRTLLEETVREAERAGVTVCLENEHICWADGGRETATLIRAIDSSALKINWDPGNAFSAGETPFPDGYEAVRGLVGHVHVKDARRAGPHETEWAIDGEIDWPGQIRALVKDGYNGDLVIETHVRPKIAGVRATLERIRKALGVAHVA
jgi:sugar phosphate isomerase/epimerase